MEEDSVLPLRVGRRLDTSRRPVVAVKKSWTRWLYDYALGRESTGSGTSYQYTTLVDGEIRVLYIEPAQKFNAPLYGTLKHRPVHWIGDFNPYMTLSYAWGALKDDGSHLSEVFFCDGEIIRVTKALHTALRYIRQNQNRITNGIFVEPEKHAQIPIWIDGICIDQANTAERTHQVQQMSEIYASSSRLIVWLGTPTKPMPSDGRERNEAQLSHELVERGIIKSPWFSRRWVIQEYGLTPIHSRFFLFGSFWSPCHEIHSILVQSLVGSHYGLHLAFAMYDSYDPNNSLLRNLYRFDGAACSSPHDLIYSLLPLSLSSPEVNSIKVDYSQSIEGLLVDVARSIVQAENLRMERLGPLLAFASAKNAKVSPNQLPSWVPDWRSASQYMFDEHKQTVERELFRLQCDESDLKSSIFADGILIKERESELPKGLKAVEGKLLLLQGRFLSPCFPPKHRKFDRDTIDRYFRASKYRGPQDDQCCWACRLVDGWEFLKFEDQRRLQAIDEKKQALFMIPRSPIVFILSRCPCSSCDVFKLECCFRANKYDDCEYLESRRKFFQVLDNIRLM